MQKILCEGEVIKRRSHETACPVILIMYLNVELKLALVAIQKCLDYSSYTHTNNISH